MIAFIIPKQEFESFKDVVRQVELDVNNSFPEISQELAKDILTNSMDALKQGITKRGGVWSGKFQGMTTVLPNDSRLGFARSDIVTVAPYYMWLEYGKNAAFGLPYEKVGGRDYKKTKFLGYSMFSVGMMKTLNETADTIITKALLFSFIRGGNFKVAKLA